MLYVVRVSVSEGVEKGDVGEILESNLDDLNSLGGMDEAAVYEE